MLGVDLGMAEDSIKKNQPQKKIVEIPVEEAVHGDEVLRAGSKAEWMDSISRETPVRP